MARIDLESVVTLGRFAQLVEELLGRLEHRAALLADEVAVTLAREVIGRRAVAEMGMDDHAKSLELLEVSIDRREMHVWRFGLHLSCELFRGAVSLCVEQAAEQQATRGRDPAALRAQEIERSFDKVVLVSMKGLVRHVDRLPAQSPTLRCCNPFASG